MVSIFPFFFSLSDFDCPASIKKLKEQNESHVANKTRMAEGMTLALEKKDQVNEECTVLTCFFLRLKMLYCQFCSYVVTKMLLSDASHGADRMKINRDIEFKIYH